MKKKKNHFKGQHVLWPLESQVTQMHFLDKALQEIYKGIIKDYSC